MLKDREGGVFFMKKNKWSYILHSACEGGGAGLH